MDVGFLLAARLDLELFSRLGSASGDEPAALAPPPTPPSPTWIHDAARTVAQHQRSGHAERAWPLLRVLEPLLPQLEMHDPASAGRVLGALATQALLEGDFEAFLDRARRAAAAFDHAGEASTASRERASLGAGYRQLGAWDDAERALRAAIAASGADGSVTALARLDLARVLTACGNAAEARALAEESAAIFARGKDGAGEGAARAWLAGLLAMAGDGGAVTEARRALDLLSRSPAGRAFAGAALARALLAEGSIAAALEAAEAAHDEMKALGRLDEGEVMVRLALVDARRAAGDGAGAAAALGEARRGVLADAAKLRDPALRRAFLEAVPEHRRALAGSGT